MEKKKGLSFLRVALIIYVLVSLAYGIGYVFFTECLVELSGEDPISSGWLRWAGGVLISLGIGAILVILNPMKQGIFVLTLAIGSLFSGLALLYTWIFEAVSNTWFAAVPALLILFVSILLCWSYFQAKEILR